MLGVGIDWAEEFHLVALGRPGEGVFDIARVEHDPRSLDALIARINELEPDPAEVRVVLETSYGMLVERLLDAGYAVVPVNPDLIARRRGPGQEEGRPRRRPHRVPARPGPLRATPPAGPPRSGSGRVAGHRP